MWCVRFKMFLLMFFFKSLETSISWSKIVIMDINKYSFTEYKIYNHCCFLWETRFSFKKNIADIEIINIYNVMADTKQTKFYFNKYYLQWNIN